MRSMPTLLLVLSLPVGVLGYTLGVRFVSDMALPATTGAFAVLIVPLFIAGLFMMPFIIPFFDRKAKEDLAEYRRSQDTVVSGAEDPADSEPPAGDPPDGEQG
jgi:hypothetical protein